MKNLFSQLWVRVAVVILPTAAAFVWAFMTTSAPSNFEPIGNIHRIGSTVTIRGVDVAAKQKQRSGERVSYAIRDVAEPDVYALVIPPLGKYPDTFWRTYSVTGKVLSVTPIPNPAGGTYAVTIEEANRVLVGNTTPFTVAGFICILAIVCALALGRRVPEEDDSEFESQEYVPANPVHRRGEATNGAPAWGYLTVVTSGVEAETGRYFVLREDRTVVGRLVNPLHDVNLLDPEVSHNHGIIERRNGDAVYRDTGSSNGSKVGGNEVRRMESVTLHNGDLIDLGSQTILRYEAVDASGDGSRQSRPPTRKRGAGAQAAKGPRATTRLHDHGGS